MDETAAATCWETEGYCWFSRKYRALSSSAEVSFCKTSASFLTKSPLPNPTDDPGFLELFDKSWQVAHYDPLVRPSKRCAGASAPGSFPW